MVARFVARRVKRRRRRDRRRSVADDHHSSISSKRSRAADRGYGTGQHQACKSGDDRLFHEPISPSAKSARLNNVFGGTFDRIPLRKAQESKIEAMGKRRGYYFIVNTLEQEAVLPKAIAPQQNSKLSCCNVRDYDGMRPETAVRIIRKAQKSPCTLVPISTYTEVHVL